jgi:hypothetical protein
MTKKRLLCTHPKALYASLSFLTVAWAFSYRAQPPRFFCPANSCTVALPPDSFTQFLPSDPGTTICALGAPVQVQLRLHSRRVIGHESGRKDRVRNVQCRMSVKYGFRLQCTVSKTVSTKMYRQNAMQGRLHNETKSRA